MHTRRQFLRATVAGSGALSLVGAAAAVDLDEVDDTYSHIDTSYEPSLLETYQPRLVVPGTEREKHPYLLSWVARSDQYETTACCYITRYTHQTGIFLTIDSHFHDTEPVYVFIDEGAGTVKEVVFTGWHWNAADISGDALPLSASRTDSKTHTSLRVVAPWHNYQIASEDTGAFFGLEDWHTRRESLVDDGLYRRGATEAFEEPWTMMSRYDARGGWWNDRLLLESDGTIPWTVNTDYLTMRIWKQFGLGGWGSRAENLR